MEIKRQKSTISNDSCFNVVFRVGAIWAAIFSPIVIIIITFMIPFGDVSIRSYILKLVYTFGGKLFLFFMISLPIWCGLYSLLQLLHKFNIYPNREKILAYSVALAWTFHAGYILFIC